VDLIFADGIPAAKAAQMVTTRIPIVFLGLGGNPVEMGLVESFDRPGGNITGISTLVIELAPKRLELFRDLVPGLHRVLFPYDANDASVVAEAKVYREAAHRLGIVLVEQAIQTQAEAQVILTQVWKGKVDGILVPSNVSLNIAGFVASTDVDAMLQFSGANPGNSQLQYRHRPHDTAADQETRQDCHAEAKQQEDDGTQHGAVQGSICLASRPFDEHCPPQAGNRRIRGEDLLASQVRQGYERPWRTVQRHLYLPEVLKVALLEDQAEVMMRDQRSLSRDRI
jgi:hypothetical protein